MLALALLLRLLRWLAVSRCRQTVHGWTIGRAGTVEKLEKLPAFARSDFRLFRRNEILFDRNWRDFLCVEIERTSFSDRIGRLKKGES